MLYMYISYHSMALGNPVFKGIENAISAKHKTKVIRTMCSLEGEHGKSITFFGRVPIKAIADAYPPTSFSPDIHFRPVMPV